LDADELEWHKPISKGHLLYWLRGFGIEGKVDVSKLRELIRSGEFDMSKDDCEKFFDNATK